MNISGTQVIAAPLVTVLNALFSRHVLVRGIPGDGWVEGELAAGPTDIAGQLPSGVNFSGQIALARGAEPHAFDGVIDLSAGSFTASATLALRLIPEGATSTRLDYDVRVAGTASVPQAEALVREAIERILASLENEISEQEARPLPLAEAPPLAPGTEGVMPMPPPTMALAPPGRKSLLRGQYIVSLVVLLVIVLLVTVLSSS